MSTYVTLQHSLHTRFPLTRLQKDNYRIIQFAKPSPEFDITTAGTLKIPEGQEMPHKECLRLHFHFCLRMYISSTPPEIQTYSLEEVEDFQEVIGMYDDDPLPGLTDPVWDSLLGKEVLRAAIAQGGAYFTCRYIPV